MSEQKKAVVKREGNPEQENKQRTNHLLIIGIDDYQNGITPLNNAVRDAKMFSEILLKQYQFEAKNVTTLFNENATLKIVWKIKKRLLDSCRCSIG